MANFHLAVTSTHSTLADVSLVREPGMFFTTANLITFCHRKIDFIDEQVVSAYAIVGAVFPFQRMSHDTFMCRHIGGMEVREKFPFIAVFRPLEV